ncbi:GPI-anchor transamidase subunit GPI16 KNAG_0D02740 [Huiozyma naganishii CBS 8797]|uniref:GPI transamidase component GPI16 n=1 Tax=Huiozyma naganishii (strain ATCC MYA-139 / BCRC 22969 / CBS 8797 / KCTC 17520 / NBRC 10181 / NCYC 3082 / Yp74L-3) TaxID=1071383 RepID=J7RKK6_HUIN7|nr:hypothetical protein KNAG_0D02740 [Kazachstania naganishii CBS 8797]CCK70023.1 hypothetical protein KNAG_0D02740 [Kazachstania naganishii CBS 8797]
MALSCFLRSVSGTNIDVNEYDLVNSAMQDDADDVIVTGSCKTNFTAQSTTEAVASPSATRNVEENTVADAHTVEDVQFQDFVEETMLVLDELKYPYQEDLRLKPLPGNHLLSSFSFDMKSESFTPGKTDLDIDQYSHYTVFPKPFKPLLERTATRQLHLRFTRGFWDAESWDTLPYDGFKSGGSGVELWAIIESDSQENAYRQWKSLANSLSGLFCASINFIDSTKTTYPVYAFHPAASEELPLFDQDKQLYLIRAALANEPVCTENLTPLIKLLPTKGKSGLSSYLDGHKVFDSIWHSLSIDIETQCDDLYGECRYSMEAMVDMVINVPNTIERVENPIPKPVEADKLRCDQTKHFDAFVCFPSSDNAETDFLFSKIFGKSIRGCDNFASSPSRVCANITDDWSFTLKVGDDYLGLDSNCFELNEGVEYDINLSSANTSSVTVLDEVPLYVSRSLTGYGQDHGGLRTVFHNPRSQPVRAIYFETLPWFMRVYLSTLQVDNTHSNGSPNVTVEDIMQSMHYVPAIDRSRPTHLEYIIEIPAFTSFAVSYQYDKTLLQFAEYPPDANHGFEIESAVITVVSPTDYQIRTATLLLSLSTPDFSMPYNVIIITSTVMGLIFGMIFNLLVKRVVTVEEADKVLAERTIKAKLLRLKQKILSRIGIAT